jgi:phage baseplate assembly protein W|tara:strand:+ start:2888 stop:3301 length:414 start_codon:yes stop_codon:yes gene_type:complete
MAIKTGEEISVSTRTYKDMALSFFANPMNGDVGKKTGSDAVKQSILSILKTNFNERLFQPEFGSNILALLFEQMNPITVERIKSEVLESVERHEPRAEVIGVTVEAQEEQNRYVVSVLFNVSSESEPQKLSTVFTRL